MSTTNGETPLTAKVASDVNAPTMTRWQLLPPDAGAQSTSLQWPRQRHHLAIFADTAKPVRDGRLDCVAAGRRLGYPPHTGAVNLTNPEGAGAAPTIGTSRFTNNGYSGRLRWRWCRKISWRRCSAGKLMQGYKVEVADGQPKSSLLGQVLGDERNRRFVQLHRQPPADNAADTDTTTEH